MAREEDVVPETRLKEVIDELAKEKERNKALETENAQLQNDEVMLGWILEEERKLVRRLINEKRTKELEQETSNGGKRRRTTEGSEEA